MYFYKKRGLQAPETEPVGLKTYMLVRVALDVGEDEWFGTKLELPESEAHSGAAEGHEPEKGRKKGGFLKRRRERKRMREEALRREALLAEREGRIQEAEASIKKLAGQVAELAGEGNVCYCVYESGIRRKLLGRQSRNTEIIAEVTGTMRAAGTIRASETIRAIETIRAPETMRAIETIRAAETISASETMGAAEMISASETMRVSETTEMSKTTEVNCFEDTPGAKRDRHQAVLPVLWQRYFDQREFTDYSGRFWVEQLMPEAVLPHFVVLGTAACIPEVIEKYAGRMKSLKWILPEAGCTEEVQEFVEDFYIESGLAISLQTISDAGEFRKLRRICVLPSNILDFTQEPNINISGAAPGSIWLDMQSMEEKRRRISGRSRETAFFSMKEKWKYAQRRCKAPVLP